MSQIASKIYHCQILFEVVSSESQLPLEVQYKTYTDDDYTRHFKALTDRPLYDGGTERIVSFHLQLR